MAVQCQPTFISLFSYCAFWGIIFVILLLKWRRGDLTDADFKAKRRENKRRAALGLPPIKDMSELDEEVGARDLEPCQPVFLRDGSQICLVQC